MTRADADGRKVFFDGTQRVRDPADTLRDLLPCVAAFGITRIAVLTGLDVLGIPVAAAVRPNSRSIAVHQGKGRTLAAAKVSAVMEAAECFHAEHLTLPVRQDNFAALSATAAAADPALLPGWDGAGCARIGWVAGRDLLSDQALWLPRELVSADFTAPQPQDAGHFQATTNGLGAGNDWLEAVLHGLYEVVERDAVALWRALPEPAQDASGLDPDVVDGPNARALLLAFAAAGVQVRIWDVTSDIALPAFVCLAAEPVHEHAAEPELGFGCHADRDIALSRALSEAAQARLTRISGARDDFDPASYAPEARAARQEAARRWLSTPAVGGFRAPATQARATLRHDLEAALALLAKAGIRQVGCVDLTRPEFGIPVVRIVVPGLEGPWTPPDGGYIPGPRARAVA